MVEPILRLEKIAKSYFGHVVTPVLHDVDLEVEAGEFTAIVGPSGSGKSTLLNLLGLLDRPTGGKLFIQGRETTTMSEDELTAFRGRSIGFIFQFHNLLTGFSATENVAMPGLIDSGRLRPEMTQRAVQLLFDVGLGEKVDTKPLDLSGGQQQRVAIARALAMHPPIVLADEPTGNLDTRTADDIFVLLRQFNRELNTTFLVVTHDPRLADRCDRIVSLVDGKIVDDQRR